MVIRIHDKEFRPYISAERLNKEVKRLANEVEEQMRGKRPLFVSILNGSFMFVADFIRNYTSECEVSFVRFSSYEGLHSLKVEMLLF